MQNFIPPQIPPQAMPQSQDQVPQSPQQDGLGMTQEEMRASLNDLMEIVHEKYRELDSKRFAYNNTKDTARKQALVVALKALQDAGVDVNDPMSVQEFADMLQQKNPEMYALFEEAFNALLGDEFQPPAPVEEVPPFSDEGGVPQGEAPQSVMPQQPMNVGVSQQ
jgi:hypothetical protein